MEDFLELVLSMPTLPWTGLVVAALVYWATVILGALDIDALGGAEGKVHLEPGHPHADVHLDAPGAEGHAHDALDAGAHAKEGVLATLLSALKLRSVPVTISLSLFALSAWVVSFLLARHVGPLLPLPGVVTSAIELAVSALLGVLGASIGVRPLAPLFRTKQGTKRDDLVGKVVRIKTGRVDRGFGEAVLEDGGAGLQLQVRCADPDALGRDDEALIIGWNEETESFDVEPMSRIEGRTRVGEGSGKSR
ncbi:MAG: hypothetical protein OHK0013_18440 [Sandaracinaceae bacterium]